MAAGPISSSATVTGNRTAGDGVVQCLDQAGTAATAAGPMPAISYAAAFRVWGANAFRSAIHSLNGRPSDTGSLALTALV